MSQQIPISIVKRERARKQEKLRVKHEMRTALPVLTREEIRRHRVPYCQAVLLELDEDGYPSAAEFLRQLMQYQEDLVAEHGPDSAVANRPRLGRSRAQLERLQNGLRVAEAAHYRDDAGQECDELIRMGAEFATGAKDWWWLGQQLLIQANNAAATYQKDGGKREAIAKYIYGKFLLENLEELQEAKELLMSSRQLSTGKSWNAKHELRCQQDTMYIECCKLLYKVLIAEAKEMMEYDPSKASRICAIARKRANDACDHGAEAIALMLQGKCEVKAGDFTSAIMSFKTALRIHVRAEDVERNCQTRIQLSLAYIKIGKTEDSMGHLNALLKLAEEHNMPCYIAQAYRFLGEFYLTESTPHEATPLLIKALDIFHDIGDLPNMEQAKNLAAISAGQELMPKYVQLILKCGKPGTEGLPYIYRLVRWKDVREKFWDDDEESIISYERSSRLDSSSPAMFNDETAIKENEEQEQQLQKEEDIEREEKSTLLDRSIDEPSIVDAADDVKVLHVGQMDQTESSPQD